MLGRGTRSELEHKIGYVSYKTGQSMGHEVVPAPVVVCDQKQLASNTRDILFYSREKEISEKEV